jgi:cell pole-organizing protein PopZ
VAIAETVDTATVAANSALDALSQRLAASAGTRGKATDNVADASSAAMPVTQPVRTLEDTVTDLLRPMLRQWLDANMPRIVEKALRVELAEGVKSGVRTDAS